MDDALTTLTPLHAAESLVLGACAHQPGIFDLCRRWLTAEDAHNLSRRMSLAVNVGLVRVGGAMRRDNDVGKSEDRVVARYRLRVRYIEGSAGNLT